MAIFFQLNPGIQNAASPVGAPGPLAADGKAASSACGPRALRPAEQRLRRVATLYTNVSHSADSLSVRERWMRGSAYRLQTGGPPVGGDAQGLENPGVEVQAYRQYR